MSTPAFGGIRLPVILQTEVAECGLACLAMIASHHGFRTDLSTLRGRFNLSLSGVSFETLTDYADRLRLGARGVQLELDELADLKTPCVLHWDQSHFVVLRSASAKGVVIHDPAVGVHHMSYAEVSRHFTGLALEMDRMCLKPCARSSRSSCSGASWTGAVAGWPCASKRSTATCAPSSCRCGLPTPTNPLAPFPAP